MTQPTAIVFANLETDLNSPTESVRWGAAASLSEFVESYPEDLWQIVRRAGCSEYEDLRMAVVTCILEHLLEHHFELLFPRVEALALSDARFANTFRSCWKFGQTEVPENELRFDELRRRLSDEGAT